MLYRVALHGFAEADRSALARFLRSSADRDPGYSIVPSLSQADLILADGDSPDAVADLAGERRVADTVFLGERNPTGSALHVLRPADPDSLFGALDNLAARFAREHRTATVLPGSTAHAEAKDAARRAARRACLAATAAAAAACQTPPDVLVLDRDDKARDQLCALLEHFGFCAYPARTVSQALWLLDTRPFRATFVDVDFDAGDSDDGAGVEVCQRVKNGSRVTIGSSSVLVIVSERGHPIDRVRATLAGANAFLLKPLARGDVAGTLESCGVLLPADERRL